MPRYDLPPLAALRAFEAAARHASFKAAADELAVTPTAISHQLRRLEAHLGRRLLDRSPQHVRLTGDGHVLFDAAAAGFSVIAEAVARLRRPAAPRLLTLSATAAFLAAWLVPRLAELRRLLPTVELRLHAGDEPVDLVPGAVDIAIRYGDGPYPGLDGHVLRDDRFAPVCHPALAPRCLDDLRQTPLLHVEGRLVPRLTPDWERWRTVVGPDDLAAAAGARFNDVGLAMQAAIAGQGVAILSLVLVRDALASGLLVQPFQQTLEGAAYHFLAAPGIAHRSEVVALRAWFAEALAA